MFADEYGSYGNEEEVQLSQPCETQKIQDSDTEEKDIEEE